jgi:Beta/Gamma crystallin.
MNRKLQCALGFSTLLLASQAFAQVTFYENEGFRGQTFTASKAVNDFSRIGFNDRASSVVVEGGRWEACEDARFGGHCVLLKKGSYESLGGMGLENRISSVRPANPRAQYANQAPEPLAAPNYDYRRRPNERLYEARVTSVREVRGTPESRCWTSTSRAPPRAATRTSAARSWARSLAACWDTRSAAAAATMSRRWAARWPVVRSDRRSGAAAARRRAATCSVARMSAAASLHIGTWRMTSVARSTRCRWPHLPETPSP